MPGPSNKAPPPRTARSRPAAPRQPTTVPPPADAQLAINVLQAEMERLREAQGILVSELSVRDGEARAAREMQTKQDGDIVKTRFSWQQVHASVADMRRQLADADIAIHEARLLGTREAEKLDAQIAAHDASLATLAHKFAAARDALAVAERDLSDLRVDTQGSYETIAAQEQTISQLRERLQARSEELSAFNLQTSGRIAELVASGLSQGETVARLSSDLGAVRTDLIRETLSHSEARRAVETGEAALVRVRAQLDDSRGLADRHAADLTALREQLWSVEKDLSASRQNSAEQEDQIAALSADIARAHTARDDAMTETIRLSQRVEADALTLRALRDDLDGAKSVMRQIATLPDPALAKEATEDAAAPATPSIHQLEIARAALESELAALRLEFAARDKTRWERERALDAARRDALAAEATVTEARISLGERDAMVSRLADDLIGRDNDRATLETRLSTLVREIDTRQTAQGKLDRRLAAIAGSSSYRWGLTGAAISRGWKRFVRRLRRGRANPLFDFAWYLARNPDVRWTGLDPYTHYLDHGRVEGRTPNKIFQPEWYLEVNPDVRASSAEPLKHYLEFGAAEMRDPAPGFDLQSYLERHPEAKTKGRHPLLHYLKTASIDEALPSGGPRILMVAWHCPTRAHAGGLRMLDLYDRLRRLAPGARLDLFAVKKPDIDWAYDDLKSIFDNIYFTDHNDLSVKALNALRADRMIYDVVDFQFLEAGHDVEAYRKIGRKLIFTPMELLSRAFHIERQIPGRIATAQRMAEQMDVMRRELTLCRAVDDVICVSRPDAAYLRDVTDLKSVTALETGVSTLEFGALLPGDDKSRASKTVVFVAYFGSPTNIEALDWYLREVHPLVRAAVPDYRLDVVGRGDLSRYAGLADPSVNLVGEVPSVGPYIARAALGISPALSGAGFRGKINQYAVLGLATVASPIAADGFAYHNGEDILVGSDAETFAGHCVALLSDMEMNQRLSAAAMRTCADVYSWAARDGAIRSIYGVKRPRQPGAPVITAVVPSYNHGRYIEERINSILSQSYPNIDLIVIDDKSPDDSDAVIRRLRDQHGFAYISRDRNTGTPFSAWAYAAEKASGEFIWICESDDVAAPDFAATAIDRLCQDRGAALYYCNSYVIDEESRVIGSTTEYFRDIWQDPRWEAGFTAEGKTELADYQVRGMIVPNMSSALIRADAFRAAWKPDLMQFRLTGDWLFIGRILTKGRAIFDVQHHSNFRKHAVTARERVKSAQSQAEFVITKYRLHKLARKRTRDLAVTLKTDATRFIYEPASAWQVFRAMNRISTFDTLRVSMALSWSILFNRDYWSKFRARVKDQRRAGSGSG